MILDLQFITNTVITSCVFCFESFENNVLYLIGPFGGAIVFGLACKIASLFKKGGKKKGRARKGTAAKKSKRS